ncbi:MAG: hypothetical protein U9R66_11600, partial [Thermodesulfobacteriota bacterium]|nr:hypothetical protein [Thermodesulfobacteriota bacterium]
MLDEDPLDLLDDDGDGVVEMCLLFDDDGKNKQTGSKPLNNSECCVTLLIFGGAASAMTWGITK